jgi:hypothetical protein
MVSGFSAFSAFSGWFLVSVLSVLSVDGFWFGVSVFFSAFSGWFGVCTSSHLRVFVYSREICLSLCNLSPHVRESRISEFFIQHLTFVDACVIAHWNRFVAYL